MNRNKSTGNHCKRLVFSFFALSLLLGGCAQPSTQIPSEMPAALAVDPAGAVTSAAPVAEAVDPAGVVASEAPAAEASDPAGPVTIAAPVTEAVEYEKYDLKNCDSALDDLHEPVTTHFKVKQEITIADQAAPVASGTTYQISATEKETLANLVEDAYQQIYQAAQAELEKQEFVAPKDRIANYSIRWDAQVYKSTVLHDFNGAAHSVEYQYILTIPVVGESTIAICGG